MAVLAVGLCLGCEAKSDSKDEPTAAANAPKKGPVGMQIGYLEFVTPDVDAFCATYEKVHGVTFGDPVAELGNARTAPLASGGRVGVRAPMRPDEAPIVRPYMATENIQDAFKAAEAAGAELAFPPTELGGHGTFAIFIHNGIESALWQKSAAPASK